MDCKKSGTEIEISERVETSEWSQHSRIRPSELDLSAFLDLTWSSSIAFSSTTPRLIWPGLWRSLSVRAPGLFVVGLHVPNEDLGDSKEGLTIRDLPERVKNFVRCVIFLNFHKLSVPNLEDRIVHILKHKNAWELSKPYQSQNLHENTVSGLKSKAICHNPSYLFSNESS